MLICYALCGSFCTVARSLSVMKKLKEAGNDLIPLCSFTFAETDTRFGRAKDHLQTAADICQREVIRTLQDAEPLGPVLKPDLMIVAPCTGNTLAKLRQGISDTPVTLAAKAHLRNNRPLLLGLCSNDALSGNFENLAALYKRKNVFFVPLVQDDPIKKPASLVCDFSKIPDAAEAALQGKQLLPLFM